MALGLRLEARLFMVAINSISERMHCGDGVESTQINKIPIKSLQIC